jgi:hypothetical protein
VSTLVVGSIALDTVETPFGRVENALGGTAVFFSLAAGCSQTCSWWEWSERIFRPVARPCWRNVEWIWRAYSAFRGKPSGGLASTTST